MEKCGGFFFLSTSKHLHKHLFESKDELIRGRKVKATVTKQIFSHNSRIHANCWQTVLIVQIFSTAGLNMKNPCFGIKSFFETASIIEASLSITSSLVLLMLHHVTKPLTACFSFRITKKKNTGFWRNTIVKFAPLNNNLSPPKINNPIHFFVSPQLL